MNNAVWYAWPLIQISRKAPTIKGKKPTKPEHFIVNWREPRRDSPETKSNKR